MTRELNEPFLASHHQLTRTRRERERWQGEMWERERDDRERCEREREREMWRYTLDPAPRRLDCSEPSPAAAGAAPPLREVDPPVHERGVVGLPRARALLFDPDFVRGCRTVHFIGTTAAGGGGVGATGACSSFTKTSAARVPSSSIAAFSHWPSIIKHRERTRETPRERWKRYNKAERNKMHKIYTSVFCK